jgi:phosphoserine phosphatase
MKILVGIVIYLITVILITGCFHVWTNGKANKLAPRKLMSATLTNEVIITDKQEAQELAAMLKKYGVKVIVAENK